MPHLFVRVLYAQADQQINAGLLEITPDTALKKIYGLPSNSDVNNA
jgi:hypothetical protein